MAHASFSAHGSRARSVRRGITDLVSQEPPARELLDEVEARLRRVIPFDSGGWWTTDPETLLPTELWSFDINVIERELTANHGVPLEGSNPAPPETDRTRAGSHDVSPTDTPGLGSDLRFVSRSGESVWGAACWTRAAGNPSFSVQEIAYVTEIAREVGSALRADLLRLATHPTAGVVFPDMATGVGTLVLGSSDIVEGFTPEAKVWLDKLGVSHLDEPLPAALRWISLQARAHAASAGTGHKLHPARSRLTTSSGELVTVQAEVLHGSANPKVVMSLEPASSRSLFPLLLALHDLTAREKTVAGLVVAGWRLDDIAAHLSLSLFTVRDHVKAIYAKVGVRSRPELTARLGGAPASKSVAVA